jgi:lysophospholipase L1-like esterase
MIKLSNLRQRLGLVSEAGESETTGAAAVSEDEMKLLEKVLAQAKTTLNEWGGAGYFIYLPERDRYVDRRIADLHDKNREQVLRIAKSTGFSVIDINDAFQSEVDPLNLFPFRRLGHYNERGHRVVADAVLESLAK